MTTRPGVVIVDNHTPQYIDVAVCDHYYYLLKLLAEPEVRFSNFGLEVGLAVEDLTLMGGLHEPLVQQPAEGMFIASAERTTPLARRGQHLVLNRHSTILTLLTEEDAPPADRRTRCRSG